VLETLLWPDEVREASFPFLDQDIEVRPQELTMASSLIDSMTSDFDPDAHHDGYREALTEVVEAKVAGHELTQPSPVEVAAGPSTSLADALRASLAAAQQAPAVGGNNEKAKAIGDGSKTGAAKSRSAKASTAKSAAKSGAAKGEADEAESEQDAPAKGGSGKPRSSRSKSGTAKPTRKAS
jgi:DNA end-binding protein Ku